MKTAKNIRAGIIGAGKVGTSLAAVLSDNRLLDWVFVRSDLPAKNIKDKTNFPIKFIQNFSQISGLPEIIFLTVSDNSIEQVAQSLSIYFEEDLRNHVIAHCSGSCSISVLETCKDLGAITAIAHPYQTFYLPSPALFDDIAWAVHSEGNIDNLKELIKKTGGKPFEINLNDDSTRGLYHASAVIASNYMNILINLAKSFADKINLPVDDFLIPILKTTLDNNIRTLKEDGEIPLTGPISRNDTQAVKLHLNSLNHEPFLKEPYKLLSSAAANVAFRNGIISEEIMTDFKKIFND